MNLPAESPSLLQITSLRADIERHQRLYHENDAPEISDSQYDALIRKLIAIEAQHPQLATPDSLSMRIGDKPLKASTLAELLQPQVLATGAADTLQGKTLVLTGTFPTLSREQATVMAEAAGGKVAGSVSRRTHAVVAGAEAGSKLTKAEELGVPVWDEAAFIAACSAI